MLTAQEGNMGNCHTEKTNVNLGFASVNIGFLGMTISHITLSYSQYLYNIICICISWYIKIFIAS